MSWLHRLFGTKGKLSEATGDPEARKRISQIMASSKAKGTYETCESLAALNTVDAIEPLLEIFRGCEPSVLTEDGSFCDEPTNGVKSTLGPGGCKDDHYPAQALVSIRGSLPRLKQLCSAEEIERILIIGNHPYVGTSEDPDVILAIGELGTTKAVGLLLFILMQGSDDEKARQGPACLALIGLAKRSPLLVRRVSEKMCWGTEKWKTRMRFVLDEHPPHETTTNEASNTEGVVPLEATKGLVVCSDGGYHHWPLTNDYSNSSVEAAWGSAFTPRDWPTCEKCRMNLADFIDLQDKPCEMRERNISFRAMMRVRHEWVLQTLIADVKAHPLHWEKPAEHWLTLDDPIHVLTIPGGYRGMAWPLLRMVGWTLWWQGGTKRMRRAYGHGQGQGLDYLWHEIGLDEDVWRM